MQHFLHQRFVGLRRALLHTTGCRLALGLLLVLLGSAEYAHAQVPVNVGTDAITGTYASSVLNTVGGFRQYRAQATTAGAAGVRKVEFYTGAFNPVWRSYSGTPTLAGFNQNIPPVGGTASALYNSGGGGDIRLPAITSGSYYTFNITANGPTVTASPDNNMAVLETTYNPVVISTVAATRLNGPLVVTATTAAAPNAVEYLYLRYSTDNFATSTVTPMVLTTGTTTSFVGAIPAGVGLAYNTAVKYYVLSSTSSPSATGAAQMNNANADMLTLNVNNNSGSNYSYTAAATTVFFEPFDADWTNAVGTPANLSTPGFGAWSSNGTGDNQWHRNDYTTGWTSTSGGSAFTSANGLAGTAARFHTFDAVNGTTGDLITPAIDLSSYTGNKAVTFSMINTSGTGPDKVDVYLSTDNGVTYGSSLGTFSIYATFTQLTVPLGSTTATQAKIKLTATSDFGATDIGIDNFFVANYPSVCGTKTVGSGGDYPNLGTAFTNINYAALTCPVVLELKSGYSSGLESSFPLTYSNNTATATNTVTVRPAAGATVTLVASGSGSPYINISGGRYLTIDGRPGGVAGTTSTYFSIGNPGSGGAVQLTNDAQNNTVQYCQLAGGATSTTAGVVIFTSTNSAVGGGNSNNTIQFNSIGASVPATGTYNLIYSAAGTGTNSGNKVDSNNMSDYFAATSNSNGILLASATNTAWTITNNNFFQSVGVASRANTSSATHSAVNIGNGTATGTGYTIKGNYIGGTVNTLTGVPTPVTALTSYALTSNASLKLPMIYVAFGTGTNSVIQGNTVQKISLTTAGSTSTTTGMFSGVYVATGDASVGGTGAGEGNLIGDASATGSITVTNTVTGGNNLGISASSAGTVSIVKNTVAGITAAASSTIANNVTGILLSSSGAYTITNNTIGSTTTANSIQASNTISATTNGQTVRGIVNNGSGVGSAVIKANTVANLTNAATNTNANGQTIGIIGLGGINTIGGTAAGEGNTVYNLSNGGVNTSTNGSSAMIGIGQTGTTAVGHSIVGNTVYGLTSTGTGSTVAGILFGGPTTGTNLISRNLVHTLTGNASTTTNLYGIQQFSGIVTIANNMVRLGLDGTGASQGNGLLVIGGIYKSSGGGTAGTNFLHNSVYVGGAATATSGSADTFAWGRGANNSDALVNNVFVNVRAQGTGNTGKHVPVYLATTTALPTVSNNVYFTANTLVTGGAVANVNGTASATIAGDQSSVQADPKFIAPTGTTATLDLHIQASPTATPVEAAGTSSLTTTDDYDGQTRSGLTPVDIGADAGNFTPTPQTLTTIVYTRILGNSYAGQTNQPVTGLTLATAGGGTALVLNSAVFTLSGTATALDISNAKLYSSPTSTFLVGTATLLATTIITAPGSITLTPATPFTLSAGNNYFFLTVDIPAVGSTIGRTVAAVPTTVTVSSSPYTSATTPAITISGSANVRTIIAPPLSGTYTVGTGGNYTTITAAITDLNLRGVSGPVVFSLINPAATPYSASETFPLNLVAYAGTSATNTVTFKPALLTSPVITNTGTTSTFVVTSAANYVFDGSNTTGGTTRDLTIGNSSTSATAAGLVFVASTIAAPSSNIVVKNLVLQGAVNTGTSAGVMVSNTSYNVSTGGNASGIVINNNTVQGTAYGIVMGNDATTPGTGLQITNNVVGPATAATATNIGQLGIFAISTTSPVITGNTVQNVGIATAAGVTEGMDFSATTGATVSGNTITGVKILAGGYDAIGLNLGTGFTGGTVNRNNINTISSSTSTYGAKGIRINTGSNTSALVVSNNFVSNINGSGFTSLTGSLGDGLAGIAIGDLSTTGGVSLYYNSVSLSGNYLVGTASARLSAALVVGSASTALDVRNNILVNSLVNALGSSTSKAYSVYSATATNAAFATMDYNDYYVNVGSQGVFAALNSTDVTPNTLAGLTTAFGQNSHSLGVDPAFTSTNLHAPAAALNNAGTPISPAVTGVTDVDIDGDARSATTPDIGGDEFTPATIDIATTALVAPAAAGCYGSAQTVTVRIQNNSVTSAHDFSTNPSTITVNVTGAATQTLTATVNNNLGNPTPGVALPVGGTIDVNVGTLNMSAAGTYTFAISTNTTGDGNAANDALSPNPTRTVTAVAIQPQTANFTGFTGANLTALYPGWYEATGATLPAGTTSAWLNSTLPASGTSAKVNLFSTGKNEWIVLPKILATTSTTLTFDATITDYNVTTGAADPAGMTGTDDFVELRISTDCGATFAAVPAGLLAQFNAGNQPGNGTVSSYSVNLGGTYAGQNIILAFFASEGSVDDAPDYDFHLDNISVASPVAIDLAPTALATPSATQSCYTSAETVSVTVRNQGTSTLSFNNTTQQGNVSVTVTKPDASTQTFTGTITTGTLAPGNSTNVTLTPTLDMATLGAGTYTFAVTATVTGDLNTSNDNLTPNPTRTVAAPTVGTLSSSATSFCNSGSATLSLTASANGNVFVQQSTNGTSYTDIAGATLPYATGTITQTMYYRVQVRCATTVTSNVITITNTAPSQTVTAPSTACAGSAFTIGVTTNSTGGAATGSNSTTPGTAIPDGSLTGATRSVNISGATTGAVVSASTAITVTLNITHGFDSALDIYLVGPAGTGQGTWQLSTDNGSGANYTNTVFNTTSSSAITSGSSPFSAGPYKPQKSITQAPVLNSGVSGGTYALPATALVGSSINGTWTLYVFDDDTFVDAGTLNSFSLSITDPSILPVVVTGPGTISAPVVTGTAPNTLYTYTVTNAPAASNVYNISTVEPGGCTTTSTKTVVVNPLPTASLSNSGPVCSGGSATATVTLGGSAGPYNLSYTVNGGSAVSLTNQTSPVTITLPAPLTANQTVQLTALSDATTGCAAAPATVTAANTTITVNPRPTASFAAGNASAVCNGSGTTLTGTLIGTGPFTGQYTVNGGAAQTLSITGSTFSIATGNLTTTSTYNISMLSDANCTATSLPAATATVTVNPLPTATLSNSGPVCGGGGATASIALGGSAGPWTFTYTVNGTGATTVTGTSTNPYVVTLAAPLTANQTVALTALSDATTGCPASAATLAAATTTVTVNTTATWTGANSNDWFDAGNWNNGCVPNQYISAVVPNGLTTYPDLTAGGTATANNLSIGMSGPAPAASLTISNAGATLDLKGNLVTNSAASLTATDGTVSFSGTAAQSIGAAGFFNLTLSGSTAKLLAGDASVSNTLNLSSGMLDLQAATLEMTGATSTIVGASATHYVITSGAGRLRIDGVGVASGDRPSATFPIGTASSYTPATVSNTGTTDYYFGSVAPGIAGLSSHAVNRTWDISEGVTGGSNVTLDLQWNVADELSGFNRNLSAIAHYDNGAWNAQCFTCFGPASGSNPYTQSRSGLSSFSPFGVEDDSKPLPVTLTRFAAVRNGSDAELSWNTASEKNNAGFEVQVSTDGKAFRQLHFMEPASANSTAPRSYGYTDREAGKAGLRYYRLRQLDQDGSASYSPVRTVQFGEAAGLSLSAAPNPFRGQLTLWLQLPTSAAPAQLTLTDATGRTLRTQATPALPAGSSPLELTELSGLASGVYYLHLALPGQPAQHLKVVKE